MSKKVIELKPKFLLTEEWDAHGKVSDMSPYRYSRHGATFGGRPGKRYFDKEKEKWISWIKSTRIEIAEASETKSILYKRGYDYLKSEIGMNIVIPKGKIKELRFLVSLLAEDKVVAIDGFPNDSIRNKEIIGGKIKIGISKALKFIPVLGDTIEKFIDIELNPWEFKLGNLKRVNVDFSGALTSQLEWYFKEDGIRNDLRVAIIIKRPSRIDNIRGELKAAWFYDPGLLKKVRLESDEKNIKIY